jgi:hypothetical protein
MASIVGCGLLSILIFAWIVFSIAFTAIDMVIDPQTHNTINGISITSRCLHGYHHPFISVYFIYVDESPNQDMINTIDYALNYGYLNITN